MWTIPQYTLWSKRAFVPYIYFRADAYSKTENITFNDTVLGKNIGYVNFQLASFASFE
jgi:hypothetical protein